MPNWWPAYACATGVAPSGTTFPARSSTPAGSRSAAGSSPSSAASSSFSARSCGARAGAGLPRHVQAVELARERVFKREERRDEADRHPVLHTRCAGAEALVRLGAALTPAVVARVPRLSPRSPADAVAHVRCERRVDDLDRLQPEIAEPVEDPLTGAEQDRGDVEDELVDHTCHQRLAHGRRAARDVDSAITCGLRGCACRKLDAALLMPLGRWSGEGGRGRCRPGAFSG